MRTPCVFFLRTLPWIKLMLYNNINCKEAPRKCPLWVKRNWRFERPRAPKLNDQVSYHLAWPCSFVECLISRALFVLRTGNVINPAWRYMAENKVWKFSNWDLNPTGSQGLSSGWHFHHRPKPRVRQATVSCVWLSLSSWKVVFFLGCSSSFLKICFL